MWSSLACALALCNIIIQASADASFRHVARQVAFSNTTSSSQLVTLFGEPPSSSTSISASTTSISSTSSSSRVSSSSAASSSPLSSSPLSSIRTTSSSPSSSHSSSFSGSSTSSSSAGNLTAPEDSVPCTGCVLQGHARATLTYEFDVDEIPATVELIPYVTVFPNSTVTSWSTIQHTPTATLSTNGTSVIDDFTGLSTQLTWEHSGVVLTYPTTYISYLYGHISGGIPTPTETLLDLEFCGPPDLDRPPAVTPPPMSLLIYPKDQIVASSWPFSLPSRLIDFFASQEGASSAFGTNNPHECTQSDPRIAMFTVTNPVAVAKTSVLVLTTKTGTPIVNTARVDPSPTPTGDTEPIVDPAIDDETAGAANETPATQDVIDVIFNAFESVTATAGGGAAAQAPVPTLTRGQGQATQGQNPAPTQNQVPAATQDTGAATGVGDAIIVGLGGNPAPTQGNVAITVGGQIATQNAAGNLVVGTATVAPGGPVATINGAIVSLSVNNAGSTVAVVNGVPTALPAPQPAILTLGTQILTANTAGAFVVGVATLSVGGPAATVGGTTISLATNAGGATVAVVNGVTSTLGPTVATGVTGVIVTNGQTFTTITRGPSTLFGVAGTTLTPGQVATVSGRVITAPTLSATGSRTTRAGALPTNSLGVVESEGGASSVIFSAWMLFGAFLPLI